VAVEVLFYFGLAVIITWPLALHVTERIPLGTEEVATVPLFNLWTLWWNADRLQNFYQGYWDAPIFHPLEGAFAFSEPQPLTGFVSAIFSRLTGSFVFAYNAIVLLALTLNGWAACRLLFTLGIGWLPALAGGAMVLYLPFVQQELGVLQLVSLAGVIATLHALVRLGEKPSARRGLLLALAFAATALTCGYYALSLSVLLLLGGGWLLVGRLQQLATWYALGAALIVSLALLGPFVGQQLRIAESYRLQRSPSTVKKFSANWEHYRYTPWRQVIPTPGVETAARPGARAFWPGTLKIGLALAGLVWGLRFGPRRWTAFCTTVLVLGLLLSFGPGSGGLSLHGLLAGSYPGFSQLRSPFRFVLFVQLMVALLAAGGLGAIWASTQVPPTWRRLLILCVGTMAVSEIRPTKQILLPIPDLQAPLPWIAWVESETRPDDVFAFLPFPKGRDVGDYLESSQWMFWQMRHRRTMVNGYSGFFPKRFRELKGALRHFPDAQSLERLVQHGVRYCVIVRGVFPRSVVETLAMPTHRLRWVFGDDVGKLDVYEVVARAGTNDLRNSDNGSTVG
jgi:hypothetical protein